MTSPGTGTGITLQLKRTFAAPRERVFRAWTDPAGLQQWFAPTDEYTAVVEVDLRVGGTYRIEMLSPKGNRYCVRGTYREIKPPEKLVYTWSWENEPEMGNTLVTVEFHDRGGATEVILTQEFFPTEKAREEHNKGWSGCLDRLAKIL